MRALPYAKERLQGSGSDGTRYPIIEFPVVRRMLMLMKAGTEAMRALALVAHIGLLSPRGRTLYFGPAHKAPAHFESAGYPLPPQTNAAEHYLEVVADADLI